MYRALYNDRIFQYPNEDTLHSKFVDLNLSCPSTEFDYFRRSNTRYDENPLDGMDNFSNALLSKSEMNTFYDSPSFQDLYVNDPLRKAMSFDAMDSIDKNACSISFFRDLKDYFNKNLLDKLRGYVFDIYMNDLVHFKLSGNDLITVTHEEFRDRALFLKRKMASAEVSIVQIYMALREKYKVIETTAIPSVGSLLHSCGYCKPCVFANKKSNYCKSGFACNFCHYNHKVSKAKTGGKTAFSRLCSQTEFFNKLIRTPKSDSNTLRSVTTDDGFSVSSSSGSILSMNDLKTMRDEAYQAPRRSDSFYNDVRGNGLFRL